MNVSLGSLSAVYLVRENITDCLLFCCSNCTPLLSLQQPPTHLSAGVLSQGLELTRQVHYHWAACPAMLCGFIFIWSLFCSPTVVCKTCALCPSSQLKACVVRRCSGCLLGAHLGCVPPSIHRGFVWSALLAGNLFHIPVSLYS